MEGNSTNNNCHSSHGRMGDATPGSANSRSSKNTTIDPFLVQFLGFANATNLDEEESLRKIFAEKVLSIVKQLESTYAYHTFEKHLIRSIYIQCCCCRSSSTSEVEEEDPSATILRLLCTSWCHLVTLHVFYIHQHQQEEEAFQKMNLLENLKPLEVAHTILTHVELLFTTFNNLSNNNTKDNTTMTEDGSHNDKNKVKSQLLLDVMLSVASDQYFMEEDPQDSIQRFYFVPALTLCCNYFVKFSKKGNNNNSNLQQQQQKEELLWNLFARHMFMTGAGSGKSTATPIEVILSTPLLMRMNQVQFDTHLAGPLKFKLLSDRTSAVTTTLQMVKVWIISSSTTEASGNLPSNNTNARATTTTTEQEDPLVDLKAHYEGPTNLIPAAIALLIDTTTSNSSNNYSNLGKELLIHLLLYASCFHRTPTILVFSLKVISLHIVDHLLQQLLLPSATSSTTDNAYSSTTSTYPEQGERDDHGGTTSTSTTSTRICVPSSSNSMEDVTMMLLSILDKIARTYNVTVADTSMNTDVTDRIHKEEREVSSVVLNVLNRIRNEWEEVQRHEEDTHNNQHTSVILLETLDFTLESWQKISQRGYSTTSVSSHETTSLPTEIIVPTATDSSELEGATTMMTDQPTVHEIDHSNSNHSDFMDWKATHLAEANSEESSSTDSSTQQNGSCWHKKEKLVVSDSMRSEEYSHEVVVLSDSMRSAEPCTQEPILFDSGMLPIAYCVEATDQDLIPEEVAYAEPYDVENDYSKHSSSRRQRRAYIWMSIGCFLILMTILLVGILVPLSKRQKQPQDGRTEEIFRQLQSVSGPAVLNESSPQGKAASWLVREDERRLQPNDAHLIQRYALAVLYFATGGDNHWSYCSRKGFKNTSESRNNDSCLYVKFFDGDRYESGTSFSYLSKFHECQWMGCSCLNPEGEIRNLTIPLNNLTGSLPSEIAQLNLLREIDVSANSLTGILPDSLGKLLSLERIDVNSNFLTGSIPDQFFDAIKLKFVDFGNNLFSGTLSKNWGKLINLQSLFLYNNNFKGELPSEMGALQKLSLMWLSSCRLQGSLPSSFGSLRALRELYLNSNELTGSIPNSFTDMTNLKQLYLSENFLSGTLHTDFRKLVNLNDLQLKRNNLLGTLPEQLGLFMNLSILDLSQNFFTGTIPSSLGQLESLTFLDLSQNQITGTIPSSLGLLNLSTLSLFNNTLTGSVPEALCSTHFQNMNESLIIVDCQQNSIGVACISQCCVGFKSLQELSFC